MDERVIRVAYEPLQENLSDFLDFDEIPSIKYKVNEEFTPRQIQCLMIAESPPKEGYFYDNNLHHGKGLRTEIFRVLDIEDDGAGLSKFCAKGYLLIDAIKLRIKTKEVNGGKLFDNGERENVLLKVSSKLLRDELTELGVSSRLRPGSKIWLIGKVARNTFVRAFGPSQQDGVGNKLETISLDWQGQRVPKFLVNEWHVFLSRFPRFKMKTWDMQASLIFRDMACYD